MGVLYFVAGIVVGMLGMRLFDVEHVRRLRAQGLLP